MQTPSDKRYNKKLDRIDRRLERGMKSERQAKRNLNKAERIERKAGEFETYNRAAGTADAVLDQYVNLKEGVMLLTTQLKNLVPSIRLEI